jgi:tRNA threonylcarbamoyl adenosine modification protein (Sua5/YciO/YrdC/YwlC family)
LSQYFRIHAETPQPRLVREAARIVARGGVIVYPTDSTYALGCHIGDKAALGRICRIRQIDQGHDFTLCCRDLSEIATYAVVSTSQYRLLKSCTPGGFTFILPAKREVPRRLLSPKKKTIGIRVPDHAIVQALLAELGEPIMTTSLILAGETEPMADPAEIRARLERQVELVIDGGWGGPLPTTLVDLTGDAPEVLREGSGDATAFG